MTVIYSYSIVLKWSLFSILMTYPYVVSCKSILKSLNVFKTMNNLICLYKVLITNEFKKYYLIHIIDEFKA